MGTIICGQKRVKLRSVTRIKGVELATVEVKEDVEDCDYDGWEHRQPRLGES